MTIRRELLTAVIAVIVLTVLLGFVYPMLVTGISQGAFPGNANGSLIKQGKVVVGSANIGQSFYQPVIGHNGKPEVKAGVPVTVPSLRYFQSRPSGTGPPYVTGGTPYNAAGTAFSNAGPNNLATKQYILYNAALYLKIEKPYDPGLTISKIPVDAVQSSASSIDPDISVANADIQAHRIAAVRGVPIGTIDGLIRQHTTARSLGFLGEPGVNVLELNLALDTLPPST